MCQKTGMLHLITLLYLHQGFRSHSHFDYANLITLFLSNMPQQRDNELLSGDQIKCNRISCFCLSGADFKGCEGASCLSKRGKGKFEYTEKILRDNAYTAGETASIHAVQNEHGNSEESAPTHSPLVYTHKSSLAHS